MDLTQVINTDGLKISVEKELMLPNTVFAGGEISFKRPAKIEGTISNSGGELCFSFSMSGEYSVSCDRCMKEIDETFFISDEEIISNVDDPQKDAYLFSGYEIDISDFMIYNLILNLPIKHLCSEDCKGLCPSCGTNLNLGECSCKSEAVDPRFEKLRELLKNDL